MKQLFTLSFLLFGLTVFSQQKTAAKQQPSKAQSTAPAAKPVPAAKSTAAVTPTAEIKPAATTETQPSTNTPDPRTAASSSQSRAVALPYNVDDKYMGRKDEFLNDITLPELPADFPVYEKEWSLKEYNQVVDAYFINHKEILKDRVREKVDLLQH
ncbi:MAG: hypothetical protein JWP12_3751 [Bacteroidetes bacterium]|nr:hypothetical protein [Bacteroidota bacterium]